MTFLSTDRIELRLYRDDDRQQLLDLFIDREVMAFVGDGPMNQFEAEVLWEKLIDEFYPQGIDTIWAVFEREGNSYIGHVSIRPRPRKKDDWEIGYYLKKDHWGKGYASEIVKCLVDYGFVRLGLTAIFATVDIENRVSQRVLEKAAFSIFEEEYDDLGKFLVFRRSCL